MYAHVGFVLLCWPGSDTDPDADVKLSGRQEALRFLPVYSGTESEEKR